MFKQNSFYLIKTLLLNWSITAFSKLSVFATSKHNRNVKGFALTLLCHKVCQNRCFPTQRFKSSAAALSHGKPFHAFPSASTACYLRERPAVGPTGTATALTPVRRDRARTPCPASPEATPVAAVLCNAMLCYAMPCCAVPCQSHAGLGSAQRPPPITQPPPGHTPAPGSSWWQGAGGAGHRSSCCKRTQGAKKPIPTQRVSEWQEAKEKESCHSLGVLAEQPPLPQYSVHLAGTRLLHRLPWHCEWLEVSIAMVWQGTNSPGASKYQKSWDYPEHALSASLFFILLL